MTPKDEGKDKDTDTIEISDDGLLGGQVSVYQINDRRSFGRPSDVGKILSREDCYTGEPQENLARKYDALRIHVSYQASTSKMQALFYVF